MQDRNHTIINNKSSAEFVNRPVQFIENKTSRESPLRESKVYMSPISRYELNKKVNEVENLFINHAQKERLFVSTPQHFQAASAAYYWSSNISIKVKILIVNPLPKISTKVFFLSYPISNLKNDIRWQTLFKWPSFLNFTKNLLLNHE